jgi:hypothetical protein
MWSREIVLKPFAAEAEEPVIVTADAALKAIANL